MDKKLIENLYEEMLDQLEVINGSVKNHVRNLTESLYATVPDLNRLRDVQRASPCADDGEEFDFYKYHKPYIHCGHVYVIELQHILTGVPIGTDQDIREYYMDELG